MQSDILRSHTSLNGPPGFPSLASEDVRCSCRSLALGCCREGGWSAHATFSGIRFSARLGELCQLLWLLISYVQDCPSPRATLSLYTVPVFSSFEVKLDGLWVKVDRRPGNLETTPHRAAVVSGMAYAGRHQHSHGITVFIEEANAPWRAAVNPNCPIA